MVADALVGKVVSFWFTSARIYHLICISCTHSGTCERSSRLVNFQLFTVASFYVIYIPWYFKLIFINVDSRKFTAIINHLHYNLLPSHICSKLAFSGSFYSSVQINLHIIFNVNHNRDLQETDHHSILEFWILICYRSSFSTISVIYFNTTYYVFPFNYINSEHVIILAYRSLIFGLVSCNCFTNGRKK